MARCCNEFSRSAAPATGRRRGRPPACPRSSRACHSLPAPASTAAASSRASVGLALAVYGAGALKLRAVRGGHPPGARRRPRRTRCSSRVFLDGGADSLSRPLPVGDPDTASCARSSRYRTRASLHRGHGLRWHPSAASLRTLHAEGKLTVLPADRLHRRRPVALHLPALLGGRRDERAASHRLARPLPRQGRPSGQPAAGPEPRRRALAVARDDEKAGRRAPRRRPLLVLGARRLGRRRGPRC